MKKTLLLIVLFVASTSIAQSVKYGIRGGLNLVNVDFEVSSGGVSVGIDTDSRTSFYVGGFAEFALPDSEHKIQTGLGYHANGFKYNFDEEKGNFLISQINIPALFKFNAAKGLYINGGAYVGIIVAAEAEVEYYDFFEDRTIKETEDVGDAFNTLDLGLSLGAEYNLDNGLFFDLRYNYGLLDIATDDEGFDGETVEIKNRVFMLGLGYKF